MRIAVGVIVTLLLGPGTVGASHAQTLGDLALSWIQGDYRSPIVCEIEGTPRRALRRVRVSSASRASHRAMSRLVFRDLEAPAETRCHGDMGREEPNLVGGLVLIHEARTDRPDLADREFDKRLREEGGFEFAIASGELRIGPPGAPLAQLPVTSFKGGAASFRSVRRGSDAYRRLAEFGARHKLVMHLTAPDGTVLEFDLVRLEQR